MKNWSQHYDPRTGKVFGVFLYYAVPETIAILALSSASFVDAIFLGQYVGASALAAVNLSVPVFALVYGLGMMVSIGGSVVCGKLLGENKTQESNRVYTSTALVSLGIGLVFLLFGVFFMDAVVLALGASGTELVDLLSTYLGVLVWFMPVFMIELFLFYFVRLDGQPALASAALVIGALVNIVLDWWLIGVLGMGVTGAAFATAMSATVASFILVFYFLLGWSGFKLVRPMTNFKFLTRAYANGFSEFANETSVGVTTFIFNWVMITRMGVEGVAALTIVNALLMVGLIASYGICDSLQPLISQNFGARQGRRIWSFLRIAAYALTGIGSVMILIMLLIPEILVGVFLPASEDDTARIAEEFLNVLWMVFIFAGFNILISVYLTSMQKPVESAFIAFSRSFALPAAFLLLLPIWLGDFGIYLALPMAEGLTFLAAIGLFLRNQPFRLIRRENAALRRQADLERSLDLDGAAARN